MTKEDARQKVLVQLNALRESLKTFDEKTATVKDFASVSDKALYFREAVNDWMMSDDRR